MTEKILKITSLDVLKKKVLATLVISKSNV